MQKSDVQRGGKNPGFAAVALRGALMGLGVILVLLAVFALFVSSGRVPEQAMSIIMWGTAALGAFSGTVMAVRVHSQRTLMMGPAISGTLFALTLIGSAFSVDGGLIGPLTPGLLLAIFGGGVLGSLISPKKKGAARSRRRG
ncbi:MAG: TIGR04086 family membrane protein [Oscillospiraceae bacterium]|nr:TIGR04086 family membrane protein [Oscillospiraceae bacterium]